MVKNWCIYLLVLLGTVIFFLIYKMWLAALVLALIILIPVMSLVLFILSIRGYKIGFKTPDKVVLGMESEVNLMGEPRRVLVASEYRVKLLYSDLMTGESEMFVLKGYGNIDAALNVTSEHCGCYSYEVTDIRMYDLFGLFFSKRKNGERCEVIVRPYPVSVHLHSEVKESKNYVKTNSPSAEIYEIREYNDGDPLKSIHWKASAKKDLLLVKESYEAKHDHPVIDIFLSTDRDMTDHNLGRCLFESTYLLNHDRPHKIKMSSSSGNVSEFNVKTYKDLDRAMYEILRSESLKEEAS